MCYIIGVQVPGRHGPVDRVQCRTMQSQLSAVYRTESSAYNNGIIVVKMRENNTSPCQ